MFINFNASTHRTIGLELELQTIDPISGALVSKAPEIIHELNDPAFKPELFECTVEINSQVCQSLQELEQDIVEKLNILFQVGQQKKVEFVLAGCHPFSHWLDQKITHLPRYLNLLERIQWPVRQFLIFGLHVHVGIDSGDRAIYIMNRLCEYIPHLIALSASSPFWIEYDTGLASSRIKIFEELPNTGLPKQFYTWAEYSDFIEHLIKTGSIDNVRDIWWDIRPHPIYGTVEVRICDALPTLKETLAITALIYNLVEYFYQQFEVNHHSRKFTPRWILRENKWRASRFGLDSEIIDENGNSTIPIRQSIAEMMHMLEKTAKESNTNGYLNEIINILEIGPSYQRQRRWLSRSNGQFQQIVKNLVWELKNNEYLTQPTRL